MKRRFRVGRVLLATGVIIAVAAAIAWQQGLMPPLGGGYRPANSIMVLKPYQHAGAWVFDDPGVGLRQEPFVAGIPEMIDAMVEDIPDAEEGFRMLFSAQPFPGHTHKLLWRRSDGTGNWYYSEQFNKEGWLCPGLFKYYETAPKEIYVKAESL